MRQVRPVGGGGTPTPEMARALKRHNALRARHASTPPLAWSAPLAASAAVWARHLRARFGREVRAALGPKAATGAWTPEVAVALARRGFAPLQHDPKLNALAQGENLGVGQTTAAAAVDQFYAEIKDYDYKNPRFDMKTGHFTQVVWRSTRLVGAARDGPFLVFRYGSEAGNWAGRFATNVMPLAAAAAASKK